MWDGAGETEYLPRNAGLVPPSSAFSLNGTPKFLAEVVGGGKHGWLIKAIQPLKSGKSMSSVIPRTCACLGVRALETSLKEQ
jgi:hypothetical protein